MEMGVGRDPVGVLVDEIGRRFAPLRSLADGGAPVVVGIGGSVAVGKSTLAARLGGRLADAGRGPVTVIGTDGFLFPNATLEARGSIDRKGEPDTYDEDALIAVIDAARAGAATVAVPTYSHRTFDVEPASPVEIGPLVVVEGVNALQPRLAAAYDLSVYLDTPEPVVRAWYVERFLGLIVAAESDPASFYARFVPLDSRGRVEMAEFVWTSINLPNLERFVLPTKANADVVLTLDANHQLV